jgi:hypothetical protein
LCRSSEGLTIADVARALGIGTKTFRKGVVIRDTTGGLVGVVAMSCPMDIDLLSK